MWQGFALGWRQVGIAFVLLAAVSMIAACYSILAVPLGHEFRTSRMVLMSAMTVLSGVSALISPFLGNWMDRVSLRLTMTLGALLLGAGYFAMSFATDFSHVLVIFGLFVAPANVLLGPVAATVLLSRWFVAMRGRALGIAIAGIAVGSMVYPLIIQGLLDAHPESWRVAFRWLALVLLCLTVPFALLVIDRPSDRGLHPDGAADDPAAAADRAARPAISALTVLANPSFWLLALVVAVVTSGMKGMITNLAPMALDVGVKPAEAARLISVYGGSGLVAKACFAAISDRMNPRLLIATSLGGFALGMVCLTQAQAGYGIMLGSIALIGFFGGLMVPVQSLVAPRIFGEGNVGRAMGLLSTATLVWLLATPPLFGRIYDVTGSYAAILLTFAALALAVMLVVPMIRLGPRDSGPVATTTTP